MSDYFDHNGYYHVAYERHTIMNPLSEDRMVFLGSQCGLSPRSRILDIGSGKGWASLLLVKEFGAHAVCVDNSERWIAQSKQLFSSTGMSDRAEFHCMDADVMPLGNECYDLILCLGTAAIFGSFEKAIRRLRSALSPHGHLIIGEPSVEKHTPKDYLRYLAESGWILMNAQSLFCQIRDNDYELLHALRSTKAEWDLYMGLQWKAISDNASAHPDDFAAQEYLEWMEDEQEAYLRYQRHFVDWNIFLLRGKA